MLGYWKPTRTTVANDFFVIPARSERPVLAHSLVNFLLDPTNAQQNFEYVGYQPAVQKPSPDDLIAAELVPQTLAQHARHRRRTCRAASGWTRCRGTSRSSGRTPTAPSRLADVARGEGSKADPQGLWASFTLPGDDLDGRAVRRPVLSPSRPSPSAASDPIFGSAVPRWNPLRWNFTAAHEVINEIVNGSLRGVFVRTFGYVTLALILCFLIGYPVAYYLARYAGAAKGVLLACVVLPFWMSYLMRMLAWVNLLQPARRLGASALDAVGAKHAFQ